MRTIVRRLLTPLVVLAMAACDETPVSLPEATTVSFTTADLQMVAGDVAPIQARVLDQEGRPMEGVSPTFTSDAPGVAFVDASGLVHAVAPGIATITASYGGATAQTRVTVTRNERGFVRSLELMADSLAVDTRMGVQSVTVRAFNGTGQQVCPALAIHSSDASVATAVAAGGCRLDVTPAFPGEATITVTADGVSDSVRVRVSSDGMTAFVSSRPAPATVFAGNTVPYTVRVIDERGNGIAGRVVNLDVTTGTLSATRVVTGADGTATVQWTLPTQLNDVGRFHSFRMRTQLPNGSVIARSDDVFIDSSTLTTLNIFLRNPATGALTPLDPATPVSVPIFQHVYFAVSGADQYGNQVAPQSLVMTHTGPGFRTCSPTVVDTYVVSCLYSFDYGTTRLTVTGNGLSRTASFLFNHG
jgi:hypothetical protein